MTELKTSEIHKKGIDEEADKLYKIKMEIISSELFDAKINKRQARVSLAEKRQMLDYYCLYDEDTDPEGECEDNYELDYYYSSYTTPDEVDYYDEREGHTCTICNKTGHFENRCFKMHRKNKNFCSNCAKSKKDPIHSPIMCSKIKCFRCKSFGHIKLNCPK